MNKLAKPENLRSNQNGLINENNYTYFVKVYSANDV